MMWLTWRQFRVQAAIALAALIAFAVLLAFTGPHLGALYAAGGISACHGAGCVLRANDFLSQVDTQGSYLLVYLLSIAVVLVTPALIGMFCGAPLLAREFETGTHYWPGTRASPAPGGWRSSSPWPGWGPWSSPRRSASCWGGGRRPSARPPALGGSAATRRRQSRFSPLVFATHGITPLGYAAFAFTLGVTAGAVFRRTVPAMAVTLAIFAAFQLAMPLWIRPHLFPARPR